MAQSSNVDDSAQVALILNMLCGFGVSEVAAAFLTKQPAMEKRIARGKKVLARSNQLFDLSEERDVPDRLQSVLRALYLLFNECYHGAHAELAVRDAHCEGRIAARSFGNRGLD